MGNKLYVWLITFISRLNALDYKNLEVQFYVV